MIAISCDIKNIAGRFFGLVTKHACDGQTDGRTDGQNYDSQDRASIARAVKKILISQRKAEKYNFSKQKKTI